MSEFRWRPSAIPITTSRPQWAPLANRQYLPVSRLIEVYCVAKKANTDSINSQCGPIGTIIPASRYDGG